VEKVEEKAEEKAEEKDNVYSRHLSSMHTVRHSTPSQATPAAPTSISNGIWQLDFDSNGLTSQLTNLQTKEVTPFAQNFYWYHSFQQDGQQNSGAYIFRPADKNDAGTPVSTSATLQVVQGAITVEVQQTFAPWLTQVIRLVNGSAEIQFEYTVGPIPVDDKQGKEIISRYTTNIMSNSTFYTDSNGREWQQRVRNYRPAWTWQPTQPVAGNYCKQNTSQYTINASHLTITCADTVVSVLCCFPFLQTLSTLVSGCLTARRVSPSSTIAVKVAVVFKTEYSS
jgi:hypothetical protein